MQACETCEATGDCLDCHGEGGEYTGRYVNTPECINYDTGWIHCDRCNGSGDCDQCNGKGKV